MVIFAVIMPVVVLVILGFIYQTKPAFPGGIQISSQRASTSSMKWEVRKMVSPSPFKSSRIFHTVRRALASSPVVSSSRNTIWQTAPERVPLSNASWERNRPMAEPPWYWGGMPKRTGALYFRKWASSFRKGITSRKSGYPSFARKLPACMRGRQTGGSCVNVSESGIRQVKPAALRFRLLHGAVKDGLPFSQNTDLIAEGLHLIHEMGSEEDGWGCLWW